MSMGIKVTAKQTTYPFELSASELIAHKKFIDDYSDELSHSFYESASLYKPDLALIKQQPEIKEYLRRPILEFLLRIAIKTKVTNGIFYQAARIFDRYCSKRIVLRQQVQLVLATCLWLSAKTYGGCNHIINNTNVPTGGRFHGPNPRARIPRLSELVSLCNGDNNNSDAMYDEGMFIQMERHILDTLNWDVCEPQLNNWLFNFHENNLIQFEMHNEESIFQSKIEMINIKRFIAEISLYEVRLIELHPSILAQLIFSIIQDVINSNNPHHEPIELNSDLKFLNTLPSSQFDFFKSLILNQIIKSSDFQMNYYFQLTGVQNFYSLVIKSLIKLDTHSTSANASSNTLSSTHLPPSPYNEKFITPLPSPMKHLPTPPSSRRGSPAGINGSNPNLVKSLNFRNDYTPPLTPVD